MGLKLKKILKEGNVDKRVGIFIGVMSFVIVVIVLLLINRNITKNNEIKVKGLMEVTTLYAQNTQVNTEKILLGTQYVAAYLADRYEHNLLVEDNALAALKVLLDSNPLLHAGFVFINNDSVVNQVDLDELIEQKLEEDNLIEDADTDTDEDTDIEENESSDSDTQEEVDEPKKIATRTVSKNISNENISILFYRSGEGYDYSALDRIKVSNNKNINENERKYKINYVNTVLTGELQLMSPTPSRYGDMEKTTITYTLPIVVDGFVKGVVGVDLDYEETDTTFVNTILSDDAEYKIVNNDGEILSSLNPNMLGKNYKDAYNKKEAKFLDEIIGTGRTEYLLVGSRAIIVTPVAMLENQVLNLIGEFNLNDTYSTNVGVSIIIAVSIVVLFILFCISIWFIMSKMFSERFDQIYNKFTENLSTEVTNNLKENLESIAIKIDANEKNVENMINTVEDSLEAKSEEEIEELLEKAKDSLLEDKPKEKEENATEKVEVTTSTEPQTATASVEIATTTQTPEVTEEKIAPVESPVETPVQEEKAPESVQATVPIIDDEVDSLINQVLKEDVIDENNGDTKKEDKEDKKEESKEVVIEKPVEEVKVPSALDEIKNEPVKSDLDEILANKDGSVTDDSFMAEAEKKLEATVEASNEELETIVPPDDINDLVNKINSDSAKETETSSEIKAPEETKVLEEDKKEEDKKTE